MTNTPHISPRAASRPVGLRIAARYRQSRNVPVISPLQLSLMLTAPEALLPSFSIVPLPENVPVHPRSLSVYFASYVTESPTVLPVTSAATLLGAVKVKAAVKALFAAAVAFAVPVYVWSPMANSTL